MYHSSADTAVLVPEVHAVSRVVLAGGSNAVFLDCLHIYFCVFQHFGGVGAESAHVGNGILEVIVDIDHRRKGPIHADAFSFSGTDLRKRTGAVRIVSGRHLQLRAKVGPVCNDTSSAFFQISGFEQRDSGVLIQRGIFLSNLFLGIRTKQNTADIMVLYQIKQSLWRVCISQHTEQLPRFLLCRQVG